MNLKQQIALARTVEISTFGQFATVGYTAYQTNSWSVLAFSLALFIFLIGVQYTLLGLETEKGEA